MEKRTDSCIEFLRALEHLSPLCRAKLISKINELDIDTTKISEIRLRQDRNVYICDSFSKIKCEHIVSSDELRYTLRSLCSGAVYAHQNTIRDGYIPMYGGGRAGVVGVISDCNTQISPDTITSINIRIPHHVRGICHFVYDLFIENRGGIIIYSPPGVGKTTLLRDLAIELSRGKSCCNVALVDTRRELDDGRLPRDSMIDTYSGYPKSLGIEIAVRTMSSDVIICDEVGYDEVEALKYTVVSSIPVIAAAHAKNIDELRSRFDVSELISLGVFEYAVGISRDPYNGNFVFKADKLR